jgi:hypothetical protein
MTDQQLWAAIGRELAGIRKRAGHASTLAVYRNAAGAPATGTLDDIEAGRVGNLDRVEAYCKALNVTFVAVLKAALDDDEDALSADALWIARMFQDGPNEDLRHAIRDAAKAQDALRRVALATAPVASPAPKASAGGSHGRGRTGRGH